MRCASKPSSSLRRSARSLSRSFRDLWKARGGWFGSEDRRRTFFRWRCGRLFVEAGVLEALGAVGEPVGFGHGVDEDGFGGGGRCVFVDERLFERFEAIGVFRG